MNISKKNKKIILKLILMLVILFLAYLFIKCSIKTEKFDVKQNRFFSSENAGITIKQPEKVKVIPTKLSTIGSIALAIFRIILVIIVSFISIILKFLFFGNTKVTFSDILFNRVPVLNIDIFDQANEFFGIKMSGISSIFLLIVAITTVLQFGTLLMLTVKFLFVQNSLVKADIKESLVHWIQGIAIQLGIIIFAALIIKTNNVLVRAFSQMQSGDLKELDTMRGLFSLAGAELDVVKGTGFLIAGALIRIFMFIFALTYLKRKLKIIFLLVISPAISLTYAIDMMGDKKSQVFNKWLNMFVSTTFSQIFHILTYFAVIEPIININTIGENESLIRISMLVAGLAFFWEGEKLTNKFSGIEDTSIQKDTASTIALASATTNLIIKNKKGIKNVVQKVSARRKIKKANKNATKNENKNNSDNKDNKNSNNNYTENNSKINDKNRQSGKKFKLSKGKKFRKFVKKVALRTAKFGIKAGTIGAGLLFYTTMRKLVMNTNGQRDLKTYADAYSFVRKKRDKEEHKMDIFTNTSSPEYKRYVEESGNKINTVADSLGADKESKEILLDYIFNNSEQLEQPILDDLKDSREKLKNKLEELGIDSEKAIADIDDAVENNIETLSTDIMQEMQEYVASLKIKQMHKICSDIKREVGKTNIRNERILRDIKININNGEEEVNE